VKHTGVGHKPFSITQSFNARLDCDCRQLFATLFENALTLLAYEPLCRCAQPATAMRVTDGQFWDDKPRWSPDGKTIFFLSSRTGFLNVWGIRFDAELGRAQGQPFQVTSFANPKLMVADDLDWQSLSLSQDRLVLSMSETSGSIWALQDVDK
jgi:WD40-like Beta Propeller Repeat